jgi:hemin uptake protein HemP
MPDAFAEQKPVTAVKPVAEQPALIDTAALFAGKTEIRLLHRGSEYRLRITKLGKLILTK